jgi:hypothetical protein
MTPAGFPHSEIPGSQVVCASPGLIAASHVLHRLLAPRHPPYALSSLTGKTRYTLGALRICCVHDRQAGRTRIPDSLSSVVKDPIGSTLRREGGARVLRKRGRPGAGALLQSHSRAGGDNRDRTGNLRLAKPALSQLSYIPKLASSRSFLQRGGPG